MARSEIFIYYDIIKVKKDEIDALSGCQGKRNDQTTADLKDGGGWGMRG